MLADVGSFRSRVVVELGDSVSCMGMLQALDVLPNGTAWFVGGCGLRFRVDATGNVSDFRAPPATKQLEFGGVRGSCKTTAAFWGVFARSEREAYVVGDTRCGLDPNTIWYRPIEKFDGKSWSATKVRFGKGAHEGLPRELAGNDELLYTLVEGDDWHGPPECALHRFASGAWVKAELECPMPKGPADRVMTLKSLDVGGDGTIWLAGSVLMNGTPTSGMVWTRAQGQKGWTEIAVDDTELANISASPNGGVFAAGRSLWKLRDGRFAEISDKTQNANENVEALWAESSERAWLVRHGAPFVWTDGKETAVAIDSQEPVVQIHGSGTHVWAASIQHVWQLRTDEVSTSPTTLTISEPKEP